MKFYFGLQIFNVAEFGNNQYFFAQMKISSLKKIFMGVFMHNR